jgi:hypothetical protein
MARFRYKHIQSTTEGKAPSDLLDGELAVNRFKGKEKIFLKNANDEIISFSSDSLINKELENKANVSDFSAHTANTEIHVTSADKTTWNAKVDASAIANFFDDAKYENSGTTKVINFYHGNTIKATIDASDFIVDGMVDDVRIKNGYLVIDFNTASGKQDISIPLTDIFDPSNYYDKTAIDNLVGSGVTSSSITDVIIENEEIVSAALTDLDERKLDASAYTPTDLSNYYTKDETSGKTELSTAFSAKVDSSTFTAHTASTVHMNNTEKTNLDSLATNIAAISGITATKVSNWDTAYTNNHTHSNKTYLDSITGNVGTMAYQATSSYSSATQVNTALAAKADTATTLAGYGITDAYTKSETSGATEISNALEGKVNTSDIISAITPSNSGSTNPIATSVVAENELTVSNALIDLDERKLDASAYTPTDLSNYYTKSETSGKTELSTAFSAKANTATTLGGYGITDAYTKADLTGSTTTVVVAKASSATTAASANSVALSNVSDADDLKAIEALAGTSGLLKKTAANTWTLDTTSYSSATQVNTALAGKTDNSTFTAHTADTTAHITAAERTSWNNAASGVTDLSGQSETIAAALVELNANKLDATAYTPTDLSNYYTKSQTSGATEISTALAGKVDTATFTGHTANTTVHHTSTSAVTSGSTDVITSGGVYAQLDGIKLKKITQSDYDQLQTKDPNTLYIITD